MTAIESLKPRDGLGWATAAGFAAITGAASVVSAGSAASAGRATSFAGAGTAATGAAATAAGALCETDVVRVTVVWLVLCLVGATAVLRVVVVTVRGAGAEASGVGWTSADAPEAAGSAVTSGTSIVGAGLATGGAGSTGCG
jgi:hypothetical protein